MKELRFFKCEKCGNVVWKVVDGPGTLSCCGQPMVELAAGTSDGAVEKHVPALSVVGNKLLVRVGEVAHPMLEAHYIGLIAVDYGDGAVRVRLLAPGDAPEAEFCVPRGPATVYEYCNLHGLWKADFTA